MSRGILERYLLREGLASWMGVTIVLLAIMLVTRFARFLAEAAAGQLPREFLLKIVALSSLQYLVILIPVSLLLAILMSLGRLYRDQEITAMTSCGAGPGALYRPFLFLAAIISIFTGVLSFELGPWAGRQVDLLIKDAQRVIQYTPFDPGRFKDVAGGRAVFYTAAIDKQTGDLTTVFAKIEESGGPSILTAQGGSQSVDPATGDRVVRLDHGYRYTGHPGRADFDIVQFESLLTRVSPPPVLALSGKRKIARTSDLVGSDDPRDVAEMQWRIAAPLTVLLLAVLAVPLAHTTPRAGRYGKLVLGILAYLAYTNLLTIGQAWIAKGHVPPGLGLWWVHLLVAGASLVLIGRRLGWNLPRKVRR